MEANSIRTSIDLVGAAALIACQVLGHNQRLQPLAMSFLGIALMTGGFSLTWTYGATAHSCLPTISTALATCVAGSGVHATDPVTRTMVAITALVSVILQCVVGLSEADIPEPRPTLDAEFVQLK